MLRRLLLTLSLPSVVFAASPLADQPSAFLRAHADSPVNWMLWGDAAFARAKAEDKPIYLAIGMFTSELSRAMRTQSFAREENAKLLNEHFVCILVDRDDEPALAALAQHYLNHVKHAQGWPLNLWLTPELKPFEGASYLPPSDEWGKEGFPNAIKRVLAAWQSDPAAQRAKADEAVAAQIAAAPPAPPAFDAAAAKQMLADSAAGWLATFDATNGGFGDPPKYPQPELLRFLLQHDDASREAALKTLRAIATSPLRDPLDGGFFRYASDPEWKLPYFQKTLIDQARLALAFLDAEKLKSDPLWQEAARGALNYALSLRTESGAFLGAEDATPENITPSYLWTHDELKAAVGGDDAAIAAFGATAAGNLAADAYLGVETAGKNVLRPAGPEHAAAAAKLLAVRKTRTAPLRDDVATAGAHAMLLAALVRAGSELEQPEFAETAKALSAFLTAKLLMSDGAVRSRPDRSTVASPRDHALVFAALDAASKSMSLTNGLPSGDTLGSIYRLYGDTNETGRLWAMPEKSSNDVWARVHAPAPDSADLPGANAAFLLASLNPTVWPPGRMEPFAAAMLQEMSDSPNIARGDQLLALQAFLNRKP